eukprot:CAMPEP_0178903510 /NCGR_PEP_ID=MMETSP0786-20121207/5192_1 /TAXON_ID=186022 /ORGANISM="Thalassionema frauenfeldii, Strain CCMP 1798" /LENGTH=109 /DNA_ID=CAMNT_0020574879 /DNA_START=148 /DNA_END=478 /DNA_ORIENTATION=+
MKEEGIKDDENWNGEGTGEVGSVYYDSELKEFSTGFTTSTDTVWAVLQTTVMKVMDGLAHQYDYDDARVELTGIFTSRKEAEDARDESDAENEESDQNESEYSIEEFSW